MNDQCWKLDYLTIPSLIGEIREPNVYSYIFMTYFLRKHSALICSLNRKVEPRYCLIVVQYDYAYLMLYDIDETNKYDNHAF